jgi:hypothetical protein
MLNSTCTVYRLFVGITSNPNLCGPTLWEEHTPLLPEWLKDLQEALRSSHYILYASGFLPCTVESICICTEQWRHQRAVLINRNISVGVKRKQYSKITFLKSECFLPYCTYTIWSKVSGHLLETVIRLSLWHTSQSWTFIPGGPTLCLYDSSNSVRETFYQVSECLWWNGSPFFLQSCRQSS